MKNLLKLIILIFSIHPCFCQNIIEMNEPNAWKRIHFTKKLNDPFIFFVVYGDFNVDFKVSKEKYRTSGIPEGIELSRYSYDSEPEVLNRFLDGIVWEKLKLSEPDFADKIKESTECYIIRGSVTDSPTLNYYQDIIGLTAYLFDSGGITLYDPQTLTFWKKEEWWKKVFEPNAPVPVQHVLTIYSLEENDNKWFHTRGLRKYGRPDLSIHDVPPGLEPKIMDLFVRFIEFQALGGIIKDGQKIEIKGLPEGMWCENKGNFDDPDFNNTHIEINWK